MGELRASEKDKPEWERCCSEICAKQEQCVAKSISSGTHAPPDDVSAAPGCVFREGTHCAELATVTPARSRGLTHHEFSVSP